MSSPQNKTYEEWLRHPLWQRKRLYVMESRGWCCEKCGDGENELHVHHTYYESGKKPWEYPDACYQCLCDTCHRRAHGRTKEVSRPGIDSFFASIERLWRRD